MKVTVKFMIVKLHRHCIMGILINSPNKASQIQTWIPISLASMSVLGLTKIFPVASPGRASRLKRLMQAWLPCLNGRSSFAIEPIDRIQMAVTSFSEPVDPIQIACPIIIADEVIFISQLWTKNVIKGIRSSSSLCPGIRCVFETVGGDSAGITRCLSEWIPNKWRWLHRLLKQCKSVWLQETLIDIQLTIRCDEGNDVLNWMPRHVDYARVIVSTPKLARGLLGGCLDSWSPGENLLCLGIPQQNLPVRRCGDEQSSIWRPSECCHISHVTSRKCPLALPIPT